MSLREVARKSLGGGVSGLIAMVAQVLCLMWLRTTVNVEMATGLSFSEALAKLYGEGGVGRFYRGLGAALLQGPLSRFGDTAANTGALALLVGWPVAAKTFVGSLGAACWRVLITPIDTVKTLMQVTGSTKAVWERWLTRGVAGFYAGALGASAATLVGHYPWFFVNNFLELHLPPFGASKRAVLLRRVVIGLFSAIVSDCVSNSVRVVKTVAQTSPVEIGYVDALHSVIDNSGLAGLFFRGLGTKILANCISSVFFSLLWKLLIDVQNSRASGDANNATRGKRRNSSLDGGGGGLELSPSSENASFKAKSLLRGDRGMESIV
eukprot:CAMPEP_0118890712 /NCGR_PEP_ID=MMETSP1166-20130328/1046_1 /TAXON_ID=1104430 /ORGANISM="Chrysoreinhardia sp, Strain CCMP3193" /LENGTH=322 /DNA_ID=CAMNT_0006829331 /DNA_START=319 /DNA_END=1287 /DNA_ORIENTATION=+